MPVIMLCDICLVVLLFLFIIILQNSKDVNMSVFHDEVEIEDFEYDEEEE